MMIPIVYTDGRHDQVKPFLLDRLIVDNKIASFRRSDGWAVIGRDPIRDRVQRQLRIPDRRAASLS